MLAGSATQKTLSISSPKQFGTIFKRNLTLEDQRLKSLYIKDKETMFEEIQQLKQEKNTLLLTVRQQQSQLQYFKREVSIANKEEGSPNRNYSRLKQSYMERLTSLEEENRKMKLELMDAQNYLRQLKNPIEKTNVDVLCMQLSDDNVRLTKILETLESHNKELQIANNKATIKLQAQIVKCQKQKILNQQLLLEIDHLKKKQYQQDNKPSQRECYKVDEKVVIELEQAKIEIRNYQQKIKYWENKFNNLQAEDQDKIEQLEKKNKELQRQLNTIEIQYEQDKQQYQVIQQQIQQQRYLRRTVILQKPQINEEPEIKETEIQIKKNLQVDKNDVLPIAKKLRLRLIGLNLSIQDIEKYLLTNESLSLTQLEENLHQSIFGLDDNNEIHLLAAYLADVENEEELTTSSRVRSIFKTLMENYTILSPQQLDQINSMISNKKQELQDLIMKKYPETFTNGFMKLDIYLDLLQNLDLHFTKIEIDHLLALITKQNKSSRILLQQIYAPFHVPEIHLNSSLDEDDEEILANPLICENPLLSENPMYSENPLFSENPLDVSGDNEPMSALDIKMCNSQELRKKSQTDLPIV